MNRVLLLGFRVVLEVGVLRRSRAAFSTSSDISSASSSTSASNSQSLSFGRSMPIKPPPYSVLFFGTDTISIPSILALKRNLQASAENRVVSHLEMVRPFANDPKAKRKSKSKKEAAKSAAAGSAAWSPLVAALDGLTTHMVSDPNTLKNWNVPASSAHPFDIGVVVSFKYFLPARIIRSFPLGIINLHPSLLPYYRGASPIQHTLIHGDTTAGVSIIDIPPKAPMDTGAILHQKSIPISSDIMHGELQSILGKMGSELLLETLADFPNKLRDARVQTDLPADQAHRQFAPKITDETRFLDFGSASASEIYNKYRALENNGGVWAHLIVPGEAIPRRCVLRTVSLLSAPHLPKPVHITYSPLFCFSCTYIHTSYKVVKEVQAIASGPIESGSIYFPNFYGEQSGNISPDEEAFCIACRPEKANSSSTNPSWLTCSLCSVEDSSPRNGNGSLVPHLADATCELMDQWLPSSTISNGHTQDPDDARMAQKMESLDINITVQRATLNTALDALQVSVGRAAIGKVKEMVDGLIGDMISKMALQTSLVESKSNRLIRAWKHQETAERKIKFFREKAENLEAANAQLKEQTDAYVKRVLSSTAMADVITWKYHALKAEYYRSLLSRKDSAPSTGASGKNSFLHARQNSDLPPSLADDTQPPPSSLGSSDSLLTRNSTATTATSSPADDSHDAPTGTVTLVFTDVQGSTELWDKEEFSMQTSLDIHNSVMRRLLDEHRGYEVKTEGDAFMVAFAQPLNALRWSIAVQYELLRTEWPPSILQLPVAAKEFDPTNPGELLWNGLRVRMGIHIGTPNCELDPKTRRMDYFGPMVNAAARVSGKACGGQVVVSESFYSAVKDALPFVAEGVEFRFLGPQQLKGISRAMDLYALYPRGLRGRKFPDLCQPITCAWDQDEDFLNRSVVRRALGKLHQKQFGSTMESSLRGLQANVQNMREELDDHKESIQGMLVSCKEGCERVVLSLGHALHEFLREFSVAKDEVRTILDRRSNEFMSINREGKPIDDENPPKPSLPKVDFIYEELFKLDFLVPYLAQRSRRNGGGVGGRPRRFTESSVRDASPSGGRRSSPPAPPTRRKARSVGPTTSRSTTSASRDPPDVVISNEDGDITEDDPQLGSFSSNDHIASTSSTRTTPRGSTSASRPPTTTPPRRSPLGLVRPPNVSLSTITLSPSFPTILANPPSVISPGVSPRNFLPQSQLPSLQKDGSHSNSAHNLHTTSAPQLPPRKGSMSALVVPSPPEGNSPSHIDQSPRPIFSLLSTAGANTNLNPASSNLLHLAGLPPPSSKSPCRRPTPSPRSPAVVPSSPDAPTS